MAFGSGSMANESRDGVELLVQTKQLPVLSAPSHAAASFAAFGSVNSLVWTTEKASGVPSDMPRELCRLVASSFSIFTKLKRMQEEKKRMQQELSSNELVRASREYRAALCTCIFGLEDRVTTSASEANQEEEVLDLLKACLAIWHLCELFFLHQRPRDDASIAYDVAFWLQEHYASVELNELERTSASILQSSSSCESNDAFWPIIYAFVMMGHGDRAWRLLASHSHYKASHRQQKQTMDKLQTLLLQMPSSRNNRNRMEWKKWHEACKFLLQTDAFVKADAAFTTLLEIMTAEKDTLRQQSSNWYQMMMAQLMLEEPKRVAHRLEFCMATCWQAFHNQNESMNHFDMMILAILQYDVQSALRDIQAIGCSFLTAHLTDLLIQNHVIAANATIEVAHDTMSLVEYFVLSYAMQIGVHRGMWELVSAYYERCRRFGKLCLRQTIEREPLGSDRKTHQVVSFCKRSKATSEVAAHVMARRAIECRKELRFGAALWWFLRANRFDAVDDVCDAVLAQCEQTQAYTTLHEAVEFLESQPDLAQSTQKLLWLTRYRELVLVLDDYQSLVSENKPQDAPKRRFVAQEAAKRVFQLINSTAAPRRLRIRLLQETEALLAIAPSVFTARQLYGITSYLNELDRSFDHDAFYNHHANAAQKQRIEAHIAHRLCDALMMEAAASDNDKSRTVLSMSTQEEPMEMH